MKNKMTALEDIKEKAFDLSPCALLVVKQSTEIISVNEYGLKMFGYTSEELIDQNVDILIPEPMRPSHGGLVKGFFKMPERRSMGVGRDLLVRRKNGSFLPVEIGLNPIEEEGRLYILVSIIDITHRKKLEADLVEKNRQLQEVNKELYSFANVAAHDLKSPLGTITGFSSLVLKKIPKNTDPLVLDLLNRIKSSASRMEFLIKEILEFSKIDSSEIQTNRVSLEKVLLNVTSDLEGAMKQANGKIISPCPLPDVGGLEVQLYQVFQNIISNALKYSKKGTPPSIHISAKVQNKQCEITIKDNGTGFDEKYSKRIFEPFERLVNSDEVEGAGIGLASVKKIIERHRGRITVASKKGEGAAFTFTLPVATSK